MKKEENCSIINGKIVPCRDCGTCQRSCPVASLTEEDNINRIMAKINNPEVIVVAQTAPAVRASLGEEFGMPIGTNVQGKLITALRKIGIDKVFDTNTGADFTIAEEATELVDRIKNNKTLPMITSCCPSWVRFAEMHYPDMLGYLSSCKSPHQMLGAVLNSYYAEQIKIKDPKNLFVVSIMPCVVKKFECSRDELQVNGVRDVDAVLTTRELAKMIKSANIDFVNLEDGVYDDPMGEATGAGAIFGVTGGVMESALRTTYELMTNKKLEQDKIKFENVRNSQGIKKASIDIDGKELKVVIVSGIVNVKTILEEIRSGKADYQFVEVMACPGGCIAGGGQPILSTEIHDKYDIKALRSKALYNIDENSKVRVAIENPVLKKIYGEYIGEPGNKRAHELLHTTYSKREKF